MTLIISNFRRSSPSNFFLFWWFIDSPDGRAIKRLHMYTSLSLKCDQHIFSECFNNIFKKNEKEKCLFFCFYVLKYTPKCVSSPQNDISPIYCSPHCRFRLWGRFWIPVAGMEFLGQKCGGHILQIKKKQQQKKRCHPSVQKTTAAQFSSKRQRLHHVFSQNTHYSLLRWSEQRPLFMRTCSRKLLCIGELRERGGEPLLWSYLKRYST